MDKVLLKMKRSFIPYIFIAWLVYSAWYMYQKGDMDMFLVTVCFAGFMLFASVGPYVNIYKNKFVNGVVRRNETTINYKNVFMIESGVFLFIHLSFVHYFVVVPDGKERIKKHKDFWTTLFMRNYKEMLKFLTLNTPMETIVDQKTLRVIGGTKEELYGIKKSNPDLPKIDIPAEFKDYWMFEKDHCKKQGMVVFE